MSLEGAILWATDSLGARLAHAAVRWWGQGSLGFGSASNLFSDAYGNTVDDVVLVVAGSSESGFVEEEDDWNLGNIPMLRKDYVRWNLRVEFTAVKPRYRELRRAVPDKASDVFGWHHKVFLCCRRQEMLGPVLRPWKIVEKSSWRRLTR